LGHAADDWAAVSTAFGAQIPEVCVSDGLGGVYFSWNDLAANSSLRLQRIADSGDPAPGWPVNGRIPTVTDARRSSSFMLPDGTGGVFIGWQHLGDVFSTTFDVYLQRITGTGQIAPNWPSEGLLVAPVNRKQKSLTMTPDGTGGVFLTWHSQVDTVRRVYAQRIDSTGALAAGWPQFGIPLCSAAGQQYFPRACPDGQGGLLVVWTDGRGAAIDIYAQHVLANGARAPGWPDSGIAVCTAAAEQELVQYGSVVSDGAGGFICTWTDRRAGNADVYAQRMTGSGSIAAGWSVDGIGISTAAADQVLPVIESDDAGGAFFAWTDNTNQAIGDDLDAYAHHVLANGTLAGGWPAGGIVLSDALEAQHEPRIVRDGVGGAYFVWNDSRNGGHLYGSRLSPSGAIHAGWAADGSPIGAEGTSTFAVPVLHPSGDLIVSYRGLDDIMAARVMNDGVVPVLASVAGTTVSWDLVAIRWLVADGLHGDAVIERSLDGQPWTVVTRRSPDGSGSIRFEDPDVHPGQRLGYRLASGAGMEPILSSEVWIVVPEASVFAFGEIAPHPVADRATLSFALRGGLPARLELFAIDGRRVWEHEVASRAPGRHTVPFAATPTLPAGVYQVRLTEGTASVTRRLVLVR
jgi:hypothetical protein